jgi:hypothetical protein
MKATAFVALVAASILALAPPSRADTFDPRDYQPLVKHPTRILVLGMTHLNGTPKDWNPDVLKPLLDRLAAFAPDAIMIEALPGESIDALWRYRLIYPEVATDYAVRYMNIAALASTGVQMDAPQAEAESRKTLAAWPEHPTAANRRRLAALFAASGDPSSALVQWWQLAPGERMAGDGISAPLLEQLNTLAGNRNEGQLIGARLAARLGLPRIYPIDDHSADDVEIAHSADIEAYFAQPWAQEVLNDPRFLPLQNAAKNLNTPEKVLETYRMLNAGHARRDAEVIDRYLRRMLPRDDTDLTGRTQIATLEARNLRQVANIREVASRYPGKKLLVIIGASHRPWFHAYLSMMTDIVLVDASEILR